MSNKVANINSQYNSNCQGCKKRNLEIPLLSMKMAGMYQILAIHFRIIYSVLSHSFMGILVHMTNIVTEIDPHQSSDSVEAGPGLLLYLTTLSQNINYFRGAARCMIIAPCFHNKTWGNQAVKLGEENRCIARRVVRRLNNELQKEYSSEEEG